MASFSFKAGGYAAAGTSQVWVNTGANVEISTALDINATMTLGISGGQWVIFNAGINGGASTVLRDSGGTALSTTADGLGFSWNHTPAIIATGGDLRDYMSAGDGDDSMLGGAGVDTMAGGAGNDTLLGGDGADTINAGAGDDIAYGEEGNDTLRGDLGNDTLIGGAGNDFLYGNAGNDSIVGGDGIDTLVGYEDDDTIYGNGDGDLIIGNAGNDYISGGEGDDTIYGCAGNDSITGDDGDDAITGHEDNDTLLGGAGSDTIYGNAGDDSILGGDGNDTLWGNAGNDVLTGGDGNDDFRWQTNSGNDTITDFSVDDSITLTGTDLVSTFNNTAVETGAAFALYGTTTLTLQNIVGSYTWNASLVGGNTVLTMVASTAAAACYRRGTRILTDRGEVAIEDITLDDKVVTHRGEARAIRWIGHRSVDVPTLPVEYRTRNRLVQFKAHAIGQAMPHRDLFVSAGHLVLVGGHLVAAINLVNGHSIVLREDIDQVEYFHIECEDEEILIAEGMPAESFFDNGDKTMFDNAPRFYQIIHEPRIRRAFRHAPLLTGGPVLRLIRQQLGAVAAAA